MIGLIGVVNLFRITLVRAIILLVTAILIQPISLATQTLMQWAVAILTPMWKTALSAGNQLAHYFLDPFNFFSKGEN